jgi:Flp pilus assembly pilin Flp
MPTPDAIVGRLSCCPEATKPYPGNGGRQYFRVRSLQVGSPAPAGGPRQHKEAIANVKSTARRGARGQGLVEYALLLSLVAGIVVAAVSFVGLSTASDLSQVGTTICAAVAGAPTPPSCTNNSAAANPPADNGNGGNGGNNGNGNNGNGNNGNGNNGNNGNGNNGNGNNGNGNNNGHGNGHGNGGRGG